MLHRPFLVWRWGEEKDRDWLLFTGSLSNKLEASFHWLWESWTASWACAVCTVFILHTVSSEPPSYLFLPQCSTPLSLSHHRKVWQELSSLICLFPCAVLPLLLILYLPLSLSFSPLLLSDGWLCSRSAGWHRACLEQYVPIKFTLSHCFLKLNWVLLSSLFVEIA